MSEGTKLSKQFLQESQWFNETEMKVIIRAIESHNRKGQIEKSTYAELLKDADSLSRYFEQPDLYLRPNKS